MDFLVLLLAAGLGQPVTVPTEAQPIAVMADAATPLMPSLEVVVTEERPSTSASSAQLPAEDFRSLPRHSPGEVLRAVPGLHVSQHTGGAKAHQLFLRGFDAEHGQDIAVSLDGIPLNEPSHVHGHGYLDLQFLMPDTLDRIDLQKGPYDARQGNFATAGAIDLVPRDHASHSTVTGWAGSFGTVGGAGSSGTRGQRHRLLVAAEAERTDGFTAPGSAGALRGFGNYSVDLGPWRAGVMAVNYRQESQVADVVPRGLVEQGHLDRYGAVDGSDAVHSERHLLGLSLAREWASQQLRLQAYGQYRRTDIWSNYTYYLHEPERGDQLGQHDTRLHGGVQATYRRQDTPGDLTIQSAFGLQLQRHRVEQSLAQTERRIPFHQTAALGFDETALGLYGAQDIAVTSWFRVAPGLRVDHVLYRGDGERDEVYFDIHTNRPAVAHGVEKEWREAASALSPKLALIFTPLPDWDVFLNYGQGFFSHPTHRMIERPSARMPGVYGAEVGTRVRLAEGRLTVTAALWGADKDSDLRFDPESALPVEMQPTRRRGVDAEVDWRLRPWLRVTGDAAWIRATEVDGTPIPYVPAHSFRQVARLGYDQGARGLLVARQVGPRVVGADERVGGYGLVDTEVGFARERWSLSLGILNLLDRTWEDAVFSYTSRPRPGGEAYTGEHFTPGAPRTYRATVSARFDTP